MLSFIRHHDHGLDYPLANEIIGHGTRHHTHQLSKMVSMPAPMP